MGKLLTLLLGLITASLQYGQATVTVMIRAFNSTGEVNIVPNNQMRVVAFTLGTRVLLTCDVTGLPEGSEVLSYRWYHNCAYERCEIRDRDPYYRVAADTLLVDVTSESNVGRYLCHATYRNMGGESVTARTFTSSITLAGTSTAFLYTPTSLLSEHALITDVQQITGSNGQQWIKCTNGRLQGKAVIQGNVPMPLTYRSTDQTATLPITTQTLPPNGHYYCLADSRKYNFNLFLRKHSNSTMQHVVTLPTPTVSAQDTSMWTLTSPDGSRVERYIVEFECRVRNITYVEKYMSVSASGGTGRVSTSVSCFGGLGQLYRVKVWAVSGPNISQQLAVKCFIPDGKCMIEVDGSTLTTQVLTSAPTAAGSTENPGDITRGTLSYTPSVTPSSSSEHTDNKSEGMATSIIVATLSISALMFLVGIVTFIAGVVMLVRAKRVLHHSSQPPPAGTDHYEMVDEGEKRAPLGAGVYEEVDKQDTQTDGHTKHYQELDLAKMEECKYVTIKD